MPGRLEPNRDACCPACSRFIGPADVCPYCDTDSARLPVWRRLRWIAIIMAVAGLAVLMVVVTHRELPRVTAKAMRPTMNYAMVRVQGKVASAPASRRGGSTSFTLQDATGRWTVYADPRVWPTAGAPVKGDVVEVAGGVRITGGRRPVISACALKVRTREMEE